MQNKKAIYESVMRNVSRAVRRALNEGASPKWSEEIEAYNDEFGGIPSDRSGDKDLYFYDNRHRLRRENLKYWADKEHDAYRRFLTDGKPDSYKMWEIENLWGCNYDVFSDAWLKSRPGKPYYRLPRGFCKDSDGRIWDKSGIEWLWASEPNHEYLMPRVCDPDLEEVVCYDYLKWGGDGWKNSANGSREKVLIYDWAAALLNNYTKGPDVSWEDVEDDWDEIYPVLKKNFENYIGR